MIGRTRIVVLAATLALLPVACGPGVDGGASLGDLPPPPPVRDLRSAQPAIPDDDLHRIVVTIPRTAQPDASSTRSAGGVDSGPDRNVNFPVEMLAALPHGVTLVAEDGALGYRDDDGRLVELGSVASRSAAADPSPGADGGSAGTHSVGGQVVPSAVAERIASLPGVISVAAITETSYAVTAASLDVFEDLGVTVADDGFFALSGDPYEPYQWPLDNRGDNLDQLPLSSVPDQSIDADVDGLEARTSATGAGVVVAVVDSGVDFDHPDLTGKAWINPGEDCSADGGNGLDDDGNGFVDDCLGWDFGHDDPTGYDGDNDAHGTHVAGIIAATAGNDIGIAGLAPDARIMDLRVDSADRVIRASAIARAIRYAVENGADIVNLSLGSQPGASPQSVTEIADAVDYAAEKGVLLVVAAGNNAVSLDDSPVYPASLDTANMVVVGASTPADGPAEFSNTGSPVDVFAPGELILSTVPGDGLAFHTGTSQAAPLVAATAALLLEQQPGMAPAEVARVLSATGDGTPALSVAVAGATRLNAAAVLGVDAADDVAAGVVTVEGLAHDDDGRVNATIWLNVDGGQFNQPFHWEASLVAIVAGEPYAVIDHTVWAGEAEAISTPGVEGTLTNERGAVYLADQDASSAGWSTTLPDGRYALLIEAVPRTDSTARLGNGYVATFNVGGDPGDDDDPGSGTGAGGGSQPEGDRTDDPDGDQPSDSSGPTLDDGVGGGDGADTDDLSEPDFDNNDPRQGGNGPDTEVGARRPNDNNGVGEGSPGSTSGADGRDRFDDDGSRDDGGGVDGNGADSVPRSRADDASDEEFDDKDRGSSADDNPNRTDSEAETIELGPDGAEIGEWAVTDIEPRTGWVDTENLVHITGTFPRPVEVGFDDNPGYVEFQSEELLIVRTGRHDSPGPVDVTLISATGSPVLDLPHAYAFLSRDDPPVTVVVGDGSDTSARGSGPVDDTDDQPGFDLSPGEGIAPGDPPVDDARSRNRQARPELVGDQFVLGNGLRVVRLDGLPVVGAVPACNEDPCRTRRI